MDKKGRFQQFASLIDACQFNTGEMETKYTDLEVITRLYHQSFFVSSFTFSSELLLKVATIFLKVDNSRGSLGIKVIESGHVEIKLAQFRQKVRELRIKFLELSNKRHSQSSYTISRRGFGI